MSEGIGSCSGDGRGAKSCGCASLAKMSVSWLKIGTKDCDAWSSSCGGNSAKSCGDGEHCRS